jgi:hypothetical protein
MSRAAYLGAWRRMHDPHSWLWKPSRKGAHAEILGIRVRVDWVARVVANA